MRIRTAQLSDAFEIANVHIASWRSAYKGILPNEYLAQLSVDKRTAAWEKLFTNLKKSCIYVGEDEDKTVAFASAGHARDKDVKFEGELYAIYADPDYYGSGFGRALFERCVEHIKKEDLSDLYCWVLADNKIGTDFYKRVGGKIVKDREKVIERAGAKLKEIMYGWEI